MLRDRHNIIPVTLAFLLHFVVFATLVIAFDWKRTNRPAVPLAIKGTLITDSAVVLPPVDEAPPVAAETPPDTADELRREAEEQKRLEDALRERERLQRIQEEALEQKRLAEEAEQRRLAEEAEKKRLADEAEQRRLAAEAEKQRQAEEAERRRNEEAERERQRQEVERKRQEDIERQRQENERQRREAEAAARRAEIGAEDARLAAVNAGALERYMFALQQKVQRNWVKPASAGPGLECVVSVRQLPGGEVVDVTIGTCNGDAAVQRSIEAAIYKASPLPLPDDPSLFERNLRFTFKPEQ